MAKVNQHYVPQFYLRLFGVNSKIIHLYNIRKKLYVPTADIRHQCYKRRFYGKDELIENKLALMEGRWSGVIREVVRNGELPAKDSSVRRNLLEFVAIQRLRTKSAVDDQNQTVKSIVDTLDTEYPKSNDFIDRLRDGIADPVLLTLGMTDAIIRSIDDLEFHLVYSGAHRTFITSDAPVVIYNLYNQSIRILGMEGTASRGIILFLPLSPHYILILYDPGIYTMLGQNSGTTQYATDKDIDALNLLQVVFADESVYFNDGISQEKVDSLAKRSIRYRKARRIITEILDEVGGSKGSDVIATHHSLPDLQLNLSFIRIKRSARKIPYSMRVNDRYRKAIPEIGDIPPFHGPKIFQSRKEKRKYLYSKKPN
jgi:hypothetical protein